MDFNTFKKYYLEYYSYLNPDLNWNNINNPIDIYRDFKKNQIIECKKYNFSDIFPDFNWIKYKEANPSLSRFLEIKEDYELHYFKYGFLNDLPLEILQTNHKQPQLLEGPKLPLADPKESLEGPKLPLADPKESLEDPKQPLEAHKQPQLLECPKQPLVDRKEPLGNSKEPLADPKESLEDPKQPLEAHKQSLEELKESLEYHKQPLVDRKEPLGNPKKIPIRFGFFLLGFGDPFIEKKLNILKTNLETIKKVNDHYIVDLYIFVYTIEKQDILNTIQFRNYVSNVYIHTERGIVGEFIYKYVSKQHQLYDYIVLFLDDIELGDTFDIDKILYIYKNEQLDILGLPLTLDSPANHKFMLSKKDNKFNYRQTNFIELFFYFVSKENFKKYLKLFDKDTRWCWGIDLCLHNLGFKLGIYDEYPIRHYFKAKSYNRSLPNAIKEFERVKRKNNIITNKINIIRKLI
jgi:hypothetical protein